jgi:hypothetical protein
METRAKIRYHNWQGQMIHLEVWKSSENREERHYFMKGGDIGYQHNTYVFGYNPSVVPEGLALTIKTMIENHWASRG